MYSFAIFRKEDNRKGTVVSTPEVIGEDVEVVVMWDDDFTFTQHKVHELIGNPVNMPQANNLTVFPGGNDDGTPSIN